MYKWIFLTLKCRDTANKLFKAMIETPNDSVILPFSDYPGPMLNAILSQTIGSLTVCEPQANRRECLQVILNNPCRNHSKL